MLHANELMIGDYIGYLPTWKNEDGTIGREGSPNNPMIRKVEMLGSSGAQLYNGEDYFDADDIEFYPIPLTPEILEKNGFKKLGFSGWEFDYEDEDEVLKYKILWRNDYPKNYSTHLTVNSFSADFGSFKSFNIKYVHELQHAPRLCGIEKEIEL